MGFWRVADIILGFGGIAYALMGFFLKKYPPLGWTTKLFWGEKEIPAWVASPFYFLLGLLLIYWGFSGKSLVR
jgi:hypothetical protein